MLLVEVRGPYQQLVLVTDKTADASKLSRSENHSKKRLTAESFLANDREVVPFFLSVESQARMSEVVTLFGSISLLKLSERSPKKLKNCFYAIDSRVGFVIGNFRL